MDQCVTPLDKKILDAGNYNQHKILRLLKLITYLSDQQPKSIREITTVIGKSPRTTYRYLHMLASAGFEIINTKSDFYQLNPGIIPQTLNKLLNNGNQREKGLPVQPENNRTDNRPQRQNLRGQDNRTLADRRQGSKVPPLRNMGKQRTRSVR